MTRIVKMEFTSAFAEEFNQVFAEVKPLITAFEDCEGVYLLNDISNSNIFFTVSYWKDESALDKYRNSELFKSTWAKVKINFTAKAEAWSLMNI